MLPTKTQSGINEYQTLHKNTKQKEMKNKCDSKILKNIYVHVYVYIYHIKIKLPSQHRGTSSSDHCRTKTSL